LNRDANAESAIRRDSLLSNLACDISDEGSVELQRRVVVTMLPDAKVVCTAEERRIFDTLLEVVKAYDLPVTLRVAGGWVRDKLLGKHSSDIDIALDTCMGQEFANKVNEFLKEKGEETRGVGVIQSNPDQSKHLETATMRVHGAWLDLVNLRSESYSEGSRIPEARFGTAAEDAERRDLTINALFYNINEDVVEDFTGKGLEDLKEGVIRTPLPPRTTFLDDPLRILRAVRFASRFGFALDDAIAVAAIDPEVQTKLRTKVSRERVGKEIQGMLRGPSPGDALTLLCRFELYDAVFSSALPGGSMPAATAWGCLHSARAMDAILSAHANLGGGAASFFTTSLTGEEREWLCLAAFLAPLHDGFVENPARLRKTADEKSAPTRLGSKKTKHVPAVQVVVKEGLKMRGKDAETIWTVLDVAGDMRAALFREVSGDDASLPLSVDRVTLGRLLRRAKEHWRLALVLAATLEMPGVVTLGEGAELAPWAIELARGPPCAANLTSGGGDGSGGGSPLHAFAATSLGAAGPCRSDDGGKGALVRNSAAALASRVAAVENRVEALRLENCWSQKPLLDGRAVMETAGCKGGPVMKAFAEKLVDWQLANPEGPAEQARAFVASVAEETKAEFAE
jgi:tRNA nucleotidyltransferase (CCA-adding enzyme)